MATNRELKVEIEALSAGLGVSVETDRLNNASLAKRVEELREQVAARAAAPTVVSADAVDDAFTDDAAAVQAAVSAAEAAPREQTEPEAPPALFGATKRAPREESTQAPAVAPEAPPSRQEPEPAAQAAAPATLGGRYVVAQGCVVHGLRGRLGAFQLIKARDVSGGQDMLAELVRSGHVVRKP